MGAVSKGSPVRALGRYELHSELASGGMATVHLGRLRGEAGFTRTVAIKRLHAHLAKDPEFVAMFVDEARLAARVRHPNVVPTLDVISEDGEIFLVMEYVPGESLSRIARSLAAKRERVPPQIATTLLVGVLHGLHAAHEAKSEKGLPLEMVHRDVSPQNVLVGVDGSAHVLDFGVAKAAGRAQTTREGQIKGKLGYMAPEQLGEGAITRQSDVYSAAVVLWELLAAKRLFDGDNEGAVLVKVIEGNVAPPGSIVGGLPRGLDEIVLCGLDKNPEKRWATARDFALALEKSGKMASPSEVAEWLQTVAGDELARRARRVAEIERGSIRVPAAAPSDPAATGGVSEEAQPLLQEDSVSGIRVGEPQSGVSSVSVSKSEQVAPLASTARGGVVRVALAALAAAALVVALFGVLRGRASAPALATAAAGASPPSSLVTAAASTEAPPDLATPPVTGTVAEAPPPTAAPPSPPLPPTTAPKPPAPPARAGWSPEPAKPANLSPARNPKSRSDCDPPFTTDVQGHKHYKMQCL